MVIREILITSKEFIWVNEKMTVCKMFLIYLSKYFHLRDVTAKTPVPVNNPIPKYLDQTQVNFPVSAAGHGQIGCL